MKDRVLIKRFFEYTKFEKLSELIDGKKFITVLNTEQQQQKHLPEFVILQVFCEVNFQFWFMNLTKEEKKKALNQDKKETCSCRELSQCMYYNSQT